MNAAMMECGFALKEVSNYVHKGHVGENFAQVNLLLSNLGLTASLYAPVQTKMLSTM